MTGMALRMKTDYRWLFCESDLAGIMLLVLDLKEVRTKDLLRVSSGYYRVKEGAARLVECGLLASYSVTRPHPATIYKLTEKGARVATLLKSVRSILDEEYRNGDLLKDYDDRAGSGEEAPSQGRRPEGGPTLARMNENTGLTTFPAGHAIENF